MPRRVRDFIEISEHTSLERLIHFLETVRDSLPPECEPELKIRGDEVFGRRLTISYMRELTQEEAACEARYTPSDIPETNAGLEQLREQLDDVPYPSRKG